MGVFPAADYDRGRFAEYLPNPQPVFEGADGAVYRITAPESALWRIQAGGGDGLADSGGGAYRSYGGDFTIHFNEREMLYLKEPCAPAEAAAPFFLQIFPANLEAADGLTDRERERGFADQGFSLHRWVGHIRAAPGQCLALARLPEFAARRIRTGQWDAAAARPLWQAEFPAADYLRRAQRAMADGGEMVAEFAYTIYLEGGGAGDGYRLRYAKSPCAPGGGDAPFFLHLEPVDLADLPEERRAYGFDNRDFGFADYATADGGGCAAEIPLPAYPIRKIRTGQFDAATEAQFWQTAIAPPSGPDTAAAGGETGAAAVARFTQTAQINGRQLIYTQRPCRAADADLTLFLHTIPADAADLPEWRRAAGFDNLDFRFGQRAVDTGDGCAALIELPDYPISQLNTGWYLPGQDRQVWNAEVRVGE